MYAAGLDIGTTGCKIVVYDKTAKCQKVYYKEYNAVHTDGNHEIDFGSIKDAVIDILQKSLNEYKIELLALPVLAKLLLCSTKMTIFLHRQCFIPTLAEVKNVTIFQVVLV